MLNIQTTLTMYFRSALLLSISALTAIAQSTVNPASVWAGYLVLNKDSLARHVLNDIPGSVCVVIPGASGPDVRVLGGKVLKPTVQLPAISSTPTALISQITNKEGAASLNYLSFVSGTMEAKDVVKFGVTETAYSSIYDKDVDWQAFNKRVSDIKAKNPSLPAGTLFGVVRVADVISITYQTFFSVKSAAKISGWGFASEANSLSQKTDESHDFKIGVSLLYPDTQLGEWKLSNELKSFPAFANNAKFHEVQSSAVNSILASSQTAPGVVLESDDLLIEALP